MVERINRREDIIAAARDLFVDQGYAATSIQQIADAVGMTKAALYYHFKDKEALLQEVLGNMIPDLIGIVPQIKNAASLEELIVMVVKELAKQKEERPQHLRWVINEFPNLNPSERAALYACQAKFLQAFADLIEPFVESRQVAERLALFTMCAMIGYSQLFINLELHTVADFPQNEFIETMAKLVACGR